MVDDISGQPGLSVYRCPSPTKTKWGCRRFAKTRGTRRKSRGKTLVIWSASDATFFLLPHHHHQVYLIVQKSLKTFPADILITRMINSRRFKDTDKKSIPLIGRGKTKQSIKSRYLARKRRQNFHHSCTGLNVWLFLLHRYAAPPPCLHAFLVPSWWVVISSSGPTIRSI